MSTTEDEKKLIFFKEMLKKIELKTKEYFKKAGKKRKRMKDFNFFKNLDLDGNGSISKEEWLKCEQMYSKAKQEKFKSESKLEEFNLYDVNKDGKLTEEELVNGTLNMLSEIEKNISLITEEELRQFNIMVCTQLDDYINAVNQ